MNKMIAALPLLIALAAPGMSQAHDYRAEPRGHVRAEQRDVIRAEARLADARAGLRAERREARDARHEWRDDRRGGQYRDNMLRVGSRLAPAYYAPRHRLSGRELRRLPQPRPHQAYIRHEGKVALINLRNGRVVALYGHRYG